MEASPCRGKQRHTPLPYIRTLPGVVRLIPFCLETRRRARTARRLWSPGVTFFGGVRPTLSHFIYQLVQQLQSKSHQKTVQADSNSSCRIVDQHWSVAIDDCRAQSKSSPNQKRQTASWQKYRACGVIAPPLLTKIPLRRPNPTMKCEMPRASDNVRTTPLLPPACKFRI